MSRTNHHGPVLRGTGKLSSAELVPCWKKEGDYRENDRILRWAVGSC